MARRRRLAKRRTATCTRLIVAPWENPSTMDKQPWSKFKSTIYSAIFRNPKSTRVTLATVALSPDDRVLDIGCGPGAAVRQVAPRVASATGVDASESMISIARKRAASVPNAKFSLSPAERLSYPDEEFSVVWTIQSWHHWNDPEAAYREVHRVLVPAGRFYIVEKETDGEHGINETEASVLATQLADFGYSDVHFSQLDKMIVISGVAI